jgi:penicillin-binding protein 1A
LSNERRPGGGDPKRPKKRRRSRRWILYLFLLFFGMFVGATVLVGNYVYAAYQDLPAFQEFDPNLTSVILDNQDAEIYKLAADENRTLIDSIEEIPKEVQLAFVATEDHRFYQHFGIDVYRVAGAIWSDVQYLLGVEGSQLEGASTITMQLARNAFLTLDQTPYRKVQEALIAVDLERRYTKDEILLKYLNQVSFGYQAAGLEAAAQTYFSKSASNLTLSEGAMLAGMLKAPSTFNPIDNMEGAMGRRSIVLNLMVGHGWLDEERANSLKQQQPEVKRASITPTTITFTGDWYVDEVLRVLTRPEVAAKYGTPTFDERDLFSKGLRIYTALDLNYQQVANDKLQEIMPDRTFNQYKAKEVPEAAVVIIDHRSGEVKALIGGMNHDGMRTFNRATQAYRQPGSAIKPLVSYLPAIDLLGWGPATVLDDSPPRLNSDKDNLWPLNYDPFFTGLLPMRTGLEQSLNTMAVRTLEAVTPRKGIEYGRKLGLTTLVDDSMNPRHNDMNLALALGGLTTGVTPLDLTRAYGTLGNMGTRVDPVLITRIENKNGEVIFQAQPQKQPVVARESVWLMVDIMKGSIARGTAAWESKGFNGWPAAGKTGTTEDWHDAWFVGFTSELVTGVWTGYDNDQGRKPLPNLPGQHWTGAGPPTAIWTAIMNELVTEKPPDWERPRSVIMVDVCRTSGMLPSPLCPPDDLSRDWFRSQFAPTQVDSVWTMERVVLEEWINPKTKEPMNRWYLWQEGCAPAQERLMIKRPFNWVMHPKDPWNIARYWPRDWHKEVPTELCTVIETPAVPEPPDNPSNPPDDGTKPPGGDTKPPGTEPDPILPPLPVPPPFVPPGGGE